MPTPEILAAVFALTALSSQLQAAPGARTNAPVRQQQTATTETADTPASNEENQTRASRKNARYQRGANARDRRTPYSTDGP